jgi:hypothetical protein
VSSTNDQTIWNDLDDLCYRNFLQEEKMTIGNARIHGNGFIQVDLDDMHRLHVWDHRIPRQRTDSSIHNHRFGFESTVLKGTLVQIPLYTTVYGRHRAKLGTHVLYEARSTGGEETTLVRSGYTAKFSPVTTLFVHEGDGYRMRPGDFHATFHMGTTVTLMRKLRVVDSALQPTVAVRKGERPDNSWSRGDHAIPTWALDLIEEYAGRWRFGQSQARVSVRERYAEDDYWQSNDKGCSP